MAVTALSNAQPAALTALVRAGRVEVMPRDHPRAASFLDQAGERISQLPLLTSPAAKYGIAYEACHDTGEALLAADGYRSRGGAGQREAPGRALRAILDSPPADAAAAQFDRLRRARNQDRYEARPVGAADAVKAAEVAEHLHAAAVDLLRP